MKSQNRGPRRSLELGSPETEQSRTRDSDPTSSVPAGFRDRSLRNSMLLPATDCSGADDIICTNRAEDADLAPAGGPKELFSLSNRPVRRIPRA